MHKKRNILAISLGVSMFVGIEDPLVIKGNEKLISKVVSKRPDFDKLVYRPKLALLGGHASSWLTGIRTNFHREIYNPIKYKR